ATEDGNDYIISGEKCFITNASYAKTIIVTAVTGKNEKGRSVSSAFIVPTDSDGLSINDNYDKMGVRGSNTAEVVLDEVRVPKENLLDRKSTRLNSSHVSISYAVFCLKKKNN